MADFKVYYLHGLGSHCESTKARATKELVQSLGGEFHCKNFNYLMRGDYPWNVVETLKGWVVLDKPTFFVGSSMGAYTWLDFVVNHPEVLENENLKKVFLITPPTTVFDNLEKWNPLFGKEKIFLRYGEDYCKPYETFIRLMHWDLKYANSRLLKLAHPKAVSIIAKRDTVVDNTPIYELKEVAKSINLYEVDDDHILHNRLDELMEILKREIVEAIENL